jgi:hypothetical protein
VGSEMLLEKENVNEVHRQRNEFGTPPPPCLIVAVLHRKYGVMEQCKMWTRNALKISQVN